jgi:regulation of enolase protein 1 (concanavalin A-like superfamily)
MNLTLHLIRKDLRTLRWLLLLWSFACLTHLGLRIGQHVRGEGAPLNAFWRTTESSERWDYLAVVLLPVLLIPILMHLDPLRGRLAFWKSVPIGRHRLLSAKFATLTAFFVLLPLTCEVVYFIWTGLASVLPLALADWAWRYLPGVVAAVTGSVLARSLKWGIPGVAVLLFAAFQFLGWPMGRDHFARFSSVTRQPKKSPLVDIPQGARVGIDPKSYRFDRTRFVSAVIPGTSRKPEERLSLAVTIEIDGLPEDTVVRSLLVNASSIQLAGRVVRSTGNSEFLVPAYNSQLPAQEQRGDLGREDFANRDTPANRWNAQTEYFPFAAEDLNPEGTPVEGKVLISLAQRKRIANLPLVNGAEWRPGLHRFSLWNVNPPQSSEVSFNATLTTVLADPAGDSGGLGLRPSTSIALWLEHQSLPLRKYLQSIPATVWRATGYQDRAPHFGQVFGDGQSIGFATDLTRSQKRLKLKASFDPIQTMRNEETPLAVARFAEEQAQVRNWQLSMIAYDDAGTIEIPFKAIVSPPPVAHEDSDSDELKPPVPPLADQLAKIVVSENPSPAEASKILEQLAEITRGRSEDSVRQRENDLYGKLAILSRSNVEVLLSAATAAFPVRESRETLPRFRNEWLRRSPEPDPFWRRVVIVACDFARPEQKAVFLRYHSPRVDLLRAIEPNQWIADALPIMCATAASERVPPAWISAFAASRDPNAAAALMAQIRQRNLSVSQVAEFIESGVLPAREAASTLWETALRNTANLSELRTPFTLAAKHGVEIAPRDLLRILRLSRDDMQQHFIGPPLKTIQSSFVQSMSLRSDCPADVPQAAPWLEQNAALLQFNSSNGRFELPGQSAPAQQFGAWGSFHDPRGLGRAKMENEDLVLTAGAAAANGVTELPRLTREIEGDFTVEVTVRPEFNLATAWDRREDKIFQIAGLLVFADDNRWIRWDHGLYKNINGHELREETMRSGRNTVIQRAAKTWDPAKPIRLRLSRHGDLFTTAWSQEGGGWMESPAFLNLGWPRKVQVGPSIGNRVTRLLSARFSDFKLVPSSQEPTNLEMQVAPHPGGEPTPTGTNLGSWGTVENPIGAGVFKVDGNALSIAVAPKFADYHIQQRMTAPRVVREVTGDFTLEATITPTVKRNWSSAELFLASGFDFYFRIGIASKTGNIVRFTFDYAGHGRPSNVINFVPPADLSKSVRFRLQRRGWMLTVAHQQEGGDWIESYPLNLRAWPAKLQAGVIAVNTSSEPFTAQFSDLKITSD